MPLDDSIEAFMRKQSTDADSVSAVNSLLKEAKQELVEPYVNDKEAFKLIIKKFGGKFGGKNQNLSIIKALWHIAYVLTTEDNFKNINNELLNDIAKQLVNIVSRTNDPDVIEKKRSLS